MLWALARAFVVAHAGDDASAKVRQSQGASEQCASLFTLTRRQYQDEWKCVGQSVEIVRQDAELQALERRGVGRKRLVANDAGPGTCLERSTGACAQEERTALGPRQVTFEERQEKGFERPIFAAISAHRTLRRAVASP